MKASIRILVTIALLLAASTTYSQIHMSGRTFDLHQIVLAQGQLHYPYIGQATFGETRVTGPCWSEDLEWTTLVTHATGSVQLKTYIPEGVSYVEHSLGQNMVFAVASRTKEVTIGSSIYFGFDPVHTWNIPERNLIYAWSNGSLVEFHCMQRLGVNPAKWFYGIEVID